MTRLQEVSEPEGQFSSYLNQAVVAAVGGKREKQVLETYTTKK